MPSLVSILEGDILDTLSRQSSSNSKNSKKTNSKAQSSTDSQKTRATARSKLMEEAKHIGEALEALRPKFDNKYNRFSENVLEGNKDTFDAWQFLFADVHNCTRWDPMVRGYMDLRLQNPPGQDGMFQVIPRMIFFTQFYSNVLLQCTLQGIHNASQTAAE